MARRGPVFLALLLVALTPPLLPLFLPLSSDAAGGWLAFVGRFHPVVVHAPVTLVPLAWVFDLIATRRTRSLAAAVPLLLWLAALSALAAFTLGILLSRGDGTTGTLVSRHYWLASGVVSTTTIAAALRVIAGRPSVANRHPWLVGSRVALTLALLLTVWTGHLGAQLTHGEAYLTEHAPWREEEPEAEVPVTPESAIFEALVQPIFREHCTTCHGASRVEGGLRLDAFAALRDGGEHGPVVQAGEPDTSEMIRRVTLPRDHEDAMPAQDRPPLSDAEVAVLHWWIALGASDELTLAEAESPPEEVQRLLARASDTSPAAPLPLDEAARIADATGLTIVPVSSEARDGLRVTAFNLVDGGVDAALAELEPLAPFIREVDLSHTDATDTALATLATWTTLRTLNLAFTSLGGRGLDQLQAIETLETLNLAGTSLHPDVTEQVATLRSLRHLIISGTSLGDAEVSRVAAALPDCSVVSGGALVVQ